MLSRRPHPKVQIIRRFVKSYPLFMDKAFLHRKYVEECLSAKEIAKELDSSRTTILKYLKVHGIPVRGSGKNIRRVRSLAFGRRIVGRQEVAHKREQELIEKMQKLRAEGLSYWKVADVLNAWGIPTKTRKGKWSAKQVHQILVRVEHEQGQEIPGTH